MQSPTGAPAAQHPSTGLPPFVPASPRDDHDDDDMLAPDTDAAATPNVDGHVDANADVDADADADADVDADEDVTRDTDIDIDIDQDQDHDQDQDQGQDQDANGRSSVDAPVSPATAAAPQHDTMVIDTPTIDTPAIDAPAIDPAIDPLVARTADRIAAVINDFKRELDARDSQWGAVSGTFALALQADHSQTYELTIVHDEDGAEYPITVTAKLKKGKEAASGMRDEFEPNLTAPARGPATAPPPNPTRRASDSELERDFLSRKRRRLDGDVHLRDGDHGAASRKRPRTDNGDDADADADSDDIMQSLSKGDLEDLLFKLRDDVQDDTSECVNHVQKLLRRFKEEWHQRNLWEDQHQHQQHASSRFASNAGREPLRNSIVASNGNPVIFPSQSADRDDHNSSTADVVRRESKLLSSQIRWVEECRRVATTIHDKREENWRTTSAGFHDRNRQDRENFQNRMLHESGVQGKVLSQILNEVRTIGLYTQSMKWETPEHLSTHPAYPPHQHIAPAFPTNPQQPPPPAGRGRGGANKR